MKNWLIRIAGVACVLVLAGCFEMVRRPQPGTLGGWESSEGDTIVTERPAHQQQPGEDSRSTENTDHGHDEVQSTRAFLQETRESPSREARERVRKVNGYALWCIERGMWAEARSHLERAIMQDSLASSLHNNLAIVHEYFGNIIEAKELYNRAVELAEDGNPYRQNLARLERHQQTIVDTARVPDVLELAPENSMRRSGGPVPTTR